MKLLSPEEIDELKQHPAVLKVNEYFLHLTPEFKEWFKFCLFSVCVDGTEFHCAAKGHRLPERTEKIQKRPIM